ncbi:MAG: glycosyltransferase [Oribacterium sp.]|nr:glycosyltransferase [Oribacterium sp.]
MNKINSVVITSIEESTSLVSVEGLMMKKVVICSNGCGISRYIKNHEDGFTFPVRASDKLLEIIKYVIDNNKKLDMIRQHGRIIYENNYSFEIFKKKLKMLLNGITC